MKTTNKILITVGVASALIVGGIVSQPEEKPFTVITWEKPKSDAQWAEDVKKENFDIKSTGVLEQMIESHTLKLAREEKAYEKYRDCPDCIRYEFREQLSQSLTGQELEDEIEKQTLEAIKNREWSIEKLRQSIERMQKEIELREQGKVLRNKIND